MKTVSRVELAIDHFKRKLRTIQQDRLVPFVLAPEIDSYLDGLKQKYSEDHLDFVKFLSGLSVESIRDELTRQIRPDSDRISYLALRTQHQNLRSTLEQAVLNNNWESASHCRDRLIHTELLIEQWVQSHPTNVTPELLVTVLASLGFQEGWR